MAQLLPGSACGREQAGIPHIGPGRSGITRSVLAHLDETATCAEHWKILLTAGMGFFTDAYDLFVIALAPGIWWLIAFRGILGFGIGGDYPVSATIMSECASRHDRGRMVALVFCMQGAGLVLGSLVAVALLRSGDAEVPASPQRSWPGRRSRSRVTWWRDAGRGPAR